MSTATDHESFPAQKSSPWLQSAHDGGQQYVGLALQYATTNPLKFVAVASFSLLSIVPVVAFLCFVAGTLLATLVAGLVWEVLLLFLGMMVLAGALSVAFCVSTCVTCMAALLFGVFQAARSSVNVAKTVTPSVFRVPKETTATSTLFEDSSKQD